MWHQLLLSVLFVALQAPSVPQHHGSACATWDVKTILGQRDSIVGTPVLTVMPNGRRWLRFGQRAPIAVRVVARGDDSIVMAMGPYRSILDSTQMVTTRATGHFRGDTMAGPLEAHYASGKVLRGKIMATCRP